MNGWATLAISAIFGNEAPSKPSREKAANAASRIWFFVPRSAAAAGRFPLLKAVALLRLFAVARLIIAITILDPIDRSDRKLYKSETQNARSEIPSDRGRI